MNERDMLDLVHKRFNDMNGVAPRYVVAEHVRFDPTWGHRILDAVVVDTWGSSGFAMHGIEIKCSRSDLKRELDHPEKSEPFTEILDYFWIAVSDKKVLSGLEVPKDWGILIATESIVPYSLVDGRVVQDVKVTSLRANRKPTRLNIKPPGYTPAAPFPRKVQVAMLRATRKTYERS